MEAILWIQNPDEGNADFVFENFSLMPAENMDAQQLYIMEMLNSKKRSKELLIEPYLKIYSYKNDILIDIKSDDLDKYGRRGAAMIFLKNYHHEDDQTSLKEQLKRIFSDTGTVVTDGILEKMFSG